LPAELFAPFFEWRTSVIVSLLEELAQASPAAKLRPMMHIDPLARRLVSVDPTKMAAITGGILALGYVKEGEALRAPLAALQSLVGGADITLGFQVGLPESGGRKEFLERMSVADGMGIRSFNFYNYGFIPYGNLGWIREALQS
jgi:hypothetical protein